MIRKGYTPEQIINKLKEAGVLLRQRTTIVEAGRILYITDQTYYRYCPY